MTTKFILLLVLPLMIMSKNAVASEGTNSTVAGISACAEYSDILGKVTYSLNQLGQREASKVVSVIDVRYLWEIKRNLKCFPAPDQSRTAYSDPRTRTTTLQYKEWNVLTLQAKIRVAVHELAVLAEYENEGEYFVSEDIMKLLSEKTNLASNPNCEVQDLTGDDRFNAEAYTVLAQKGYVISSSKTALKVETYTLGSVGCGGTGCRYEKFEAHIFKDGDYRKGTVVPSKVGKAYPGSYSDDIQDLILSVVKRLPACGRAKK